MTQKLAIFEVHHDANFTSKSEFHPNAKSEKYALMSNIILLEIPCKSLLQDILIGH